MKKKILFVITYLELGGAQKQLLSIIKDIDPNKYSLYLFAGDRGYLKDKFKQIKNLNMQLSSRLNRRINPIVDFLAFWQLYSHIKKNKFDIVHLHSPKAGFLGRWAAYFAGVKNIVYTVHGWSFHKFMKKPFYEFCLFLEKITSKITKKFTLSSLFRAIYS